MSTLQVDTFIEYTPLFTTLNAYKCLPSVYASIAHSFCFSLCDCFELYLHINDELSVYSVDQVWKLRCSVVQRYYRYSTACATQLKILCLYTISELSLSDSVASSLVESDNSQVTDT